MSGRTLPGTMRSLQSAAGSHSGGPCTLMLAMPAASQQISGGRSRSAWAAVRMIGASTVKAAASANASWPHAVSGSMERLACSHGMVDSASERRS
jgi:hypothetical protein